MLLARNTVVLGVCACLLLMGRALADELDYGIEQRQVGSLEFEGNESFSDDRLESLLPFRISKWYTPFRSSRYRTDQLPIAVRTLRTFYVRQGYHQANVDVEREIGEEGAGDHIVFHIVEGERTTVESVVIHGGESIDQEKLRERLYYRAGGPAPVNRTDLGEDEFTLLQAFYSKGYLNARVQGWIERLDSHRVRIHFDIHTGKSYRVSDIRVSGHKNTKEEYIRRELRIEVGDPFDLDLISQSEGNLLFRGWFRDVSFQPVDIDTANALAALEVSVIERPTGFYEVGVGTGDEDRVRVSGGWGNRNIFGTGRSVRVRGRLLWGFEDVLGESSQRELFLDHEEEVTYRTPYAFGTPLDLGASAYFRRETRGLVGVQLERSGFLVNTELWRSGFRTLELEGSVERVLKLPLEGVNSEDLGKPRSVTHSVSTVLTRDSRDSPFNPTRGSIRATLFETAGSILGGNNDYNKALGVFAHVKSFWGQFSLATRVRLGWAEAFGRSRDDDVPLEARYFAGGSNSVRGYRENSLGPRLTEEDAQSVVDDRFLANRPTSGGNALMELNAEFRFPLPYISRWKFFGAVFADGGNVWENWSRVSLQRMRLTSDPEGDDPTTILDFRTSIGFSLHYRTVVGPLRLDYGLPLKRVRLVDPDTGEVEEDPHHIWHFSLGHAF